MTNAHPPAPEREREDAYTPGPWEYDGGWQIVEGARPHMRIAFLPSDRDPDQPPGHNGDLIAAAPELLEACRAALGAFQNNNAIDWSDLERAIAKAEGRT